MNRKRARKATRRRPLFVRQDEANQQLETSLAAVPISAPFGSPENFLLGYVWCQVPASVRRAAIASLKRCYA